MQDSLCPLSTISVPTSRSPEIFSSRQVREHKLSRPTISRHFSVFSFLFPISYFLVPPFRATHLTLSRQWITIEKSQNLYRRFAKNKVQKAPVRRISRLFVGVWFRHWSRKGARRAKERKKKTKITKLDFHRFQVRHFSNNFEQSPCYCKMGQRQRAYLGVF